MKHRKGRGLKDKKIRLPCGGLWTSLAFASLQAGDYCLKEGRVYCGPSNTYQPRYYGVWYRPYDEAAKRVVFVQEEE